MKTIRGICFVVTLLLANPAFAQLLGIGDALTGKRDVSVIKTTWFDIIYPAESAPAAEILAQNADALYEKAAALLKTEPSFHIPLVITRSSDSLNAYYSPYPYKRLVVYDTVPDYSLSVQGDSLLSVVYHEIIHAVSLNLKHPAWRTVSDIFGDVFNPVYFNAPWSFIEGVTVGNEALAGDGRLNDGYSLHMVRQAKIEGKFPRWNDATGFRDTFPGGNIPYLFGGAFTAWLEEQYGMEKYAALWRTANNSLPIRMNFYNTYGIEIAKAWDLFRDSLWVPEIPPRPEDAPGAGVRRIFGGNGVYSQVSYSSAGIAWVEGYSGAVYFLPHGGVPGGKPRKLLSKINLSRASLSADGAYMALSWNTGADHNVNRVSVLERKTGRVADSGVDSLRDGTVVTIGGERYLCAVRTAGQTASLVYYPLKKGGPRVGGEAFRRDFPRMTIPFSPVDAGKGLTAFVRKEGTGWSIALLDPRTQTLSVYGAPLPGMMLRYLNARPDGEKVTLYFSWTGPGTLPRAGTLEIGPDGTGAWTLSDRDLSGGVYGNAPYRSGAGEVLVYAARFYETSALFAAAAAPDGAAPGVNAPEEASVSGEAESAAPPASSPPAVPYNPARYWGRGVFLPLSTMTVSDESFEAKTALFLGAAYLTGDPGELAGVSATAGYDIVSNSYGLGLAAAGGRDLFSFDTSGSVLFSDADFSQALVTNTFASTLRPGGNTALTFSDRIRWFYGRPYSGSITEQNADRFWGKGGGTDPSLQGDFTHTIENTFTFAVSTIRSRGAGYFNRGGAALGAFLLTDYRTAGPGVYNNLGLTGTLRFPRLIPVDNPVDATVNLPLTLTALAFPSRDRFLEGRVFLVPYSREIQRGGGVFFFQRVTFTALYTGYLRNSNASGDIFHLAALAGDIPSMPYRDSLTLSTYADMGYNAGVFTSVPIELGSDVTVYPCRDEGELLFQFTLHLKLPL
ncbi:MAG: hypothetical protein LBR23_09660 [Spirochaetaceae bacterium]|jgi:hypothetical protein|nr:hypothetical protein [Spirochaetaceae bacterium]